jgi:hypothetical protein
MTTIQSEVKQRKGKPVGLHVVTHVCAFQADALEVLRLVRSIMNTFVRTNPVPPEVLPTSVPGYLSKNKVDKISVALSHVFCRWRDTFMSRPSLWTRFDFDNIGKTRIYIQYSQSSPFNICVGAAKGIDDAFRPIIPHTHRLRSMIINPCAPPQTSLHIFIFS